MTEPNYASASVMFDASKMKLRDTHMRMIRFLSALMGATSLVIGALSPAIAEQTAPPKLTMELNAAQSTGDGCSFSFLINNDLPTTIDAMVLEAVLFDAGGQVERLTLFDFGALPAGRPRVRQFLVPGPACDGFGSILINGAQVCEIDGAASLACENTLDLRSRTAIDLIG